MAGAFLATTSTHPFEGWKIESEEVTKMGAFDNQTDTIQIHSKHWDGHEGVTARVIPTVEDEEWVNDQVLKMTRSEKGKKSTLDIESNLGATRRLWLERLIVSWTLTKGGQSVPLSSKAIRQLPTAYADYIYDQIQAHQPDMSEDEEESFLEGAEPSTTEAVKKLSRVK